MDSLDLPSPLTSKSFGCARRSRASDTHEPRTPGSTSNRRSRPLRSRDPATRPRKALSSARGRSETAMWVKLLGECARERERRVGLHPNASLAVAAIARRFFRRVSILIVFITTPGAAALKRAGRQRAAACRVATGDFGSASGGKAPVGARRSGFKGSCGCRRAVVRVLLRCGGSGSGAVFCSFRQ